MGRILAQKLRGKKPGSTENGRKDQLLKRLINLKAFMKSAGYDEEFNEIESLIEKHSSKRLEYLNENYSQKLKQLRNSDQELRNKWAEIMNKEGGYSKELAADFAKEHGTKTDDLFNDAERQKEFEPLFNSLSEEDFNNFTDDDWKNLWLLTQHADHNRELQKRVRDVLKTYNREEEYKYIADRISCGESGTQEYGTQDICEKDLSRRKQVLLRKKRTRDILKMFTKTNMIKKSL